MAGFAFKGFVAGRTGLATVLLLVAAAGCSPSPPQPSASASASATGSGSATAAGSASASSPGSSGAATTAPAGNGSSAEATPPADADETSPAANGDRVISSTVTHDWAVPSADAPFRTAHQNPVPLAPPPAEPLPELFTIGAGQHPAGTPPYDQLSFRFTGAFPGYEISFVPELRADGSGKLIPMPGTGAILKVVFRGAQAHTADGTASTITDSPAPAIGYRALTSYAPAGDFEGVLSYGLGVGRPGTPAPQTKLRVYEVERIEQGRHLYVVAIQLDAGSQ